VSPLVTVSGALHSPFHIKAGSGIDEIAVLLSSSHSHTNSRTARVQQGPGGHGFPDEKDAKDEATTRDRAGGMKDVLCPDRKSETQAEAEKEEGETTRIVLLFPSCVYKYMKIERFALGLRSVFASCGTF
jgi:hypothetical protein